MNANSSTVRYLKVRQQVAWGFSLAGNDNHLCESSTDCSDVPLIRLDENRFDAAYNLAVSLNPGYPSWLCADFRQEPQYFPFNTDGYDVSGNNILIENGYVFNGDDCVAGK